MMIVELPGVANVPVTATFPEAVIVSLKLLFTVPELVKFAQPMLAPSPSRT